MEIAKIAGKEAVLVIGDAEIVIVFCINSDKTLDAVI
jgi:hypothetical protein